MFKDILSQQQLSTIMTVAGLIVILASKLGYSLTTEDVSFVLASLWSLGWSAYAYYDRWSKGDINLLGVKYGKF